MNSNWDIKVIEKPWTMTTEVYIIEKGGRCAYLAHISNGLLQMTEINESAEVAEPTFIFPTELWNSMKELLIDNKVREKNEVEAELSATKYHLEDMRLLAGVMGTVRRIK